jgi:hypothetical protein
MRDRQTRPPLTTRVPADVRIGEIAAINNCTAILTDPAGKYKLTGPEALKALGGLSLYTTAEACPMVRLSLLPPGYTMFFCARPSPSL